MKKSVFNSPLLKSKVKSVNIKLPELIFGYFLGPALALLVSGIFVNGFLNEYYTSYLFVNLLKDSKWSNIVNTYLTLLPTLSAILIVVGNLFAGQLIERTNTTAGKARPWILLSAILMPVASILIFAIPLFFDPEANPVLTMVITAIGYNLFFAAAYPIYYTANSSLVPVSTRNGKQRGLLASASNMAVTTGVGLGGMVFPFMRDLLINSAGSLNAQRGMWLLVFAIVSVVTMIAIVVQYMFTRERVNEEKFAQSETVQTAEVKKVSIGQQFKAVATDKYWWIVLVFCFLFQFSGTMKNFSLNYYSRFFKGVKFVEDLGGPGAVQSLITILGSVPMTLAVAIVWPLSNKYGKRAMVVAGLVTNVVGNVIVQIGGNNLIVVSVGAFFKYLGAAPGCYMMLAMISDALDHTEARNGFRCDGLTMSIYASIMIASQPLVQGVFNAMTNSGENQAMSNFCYIWGEGIIYAALAVLMLFYNVEKFSKEDHEKIIAYQKAEVEAAGGVWVDPEERLRLEQEEADRIAEEAKLAELKAHCDKKGLNYETELAKLREKEAKKNKGKKD